MFWRLLLPDAPLVVPLYGEGNGRIRAWSFSLWDTPTYLWLSAAP